MSENAIKRTAAKPKSASGKAAPARTQNKSGKRMPPQGQGGRARVPSAKGSGRPAKASAEPGKRTAPRNAEGKARANIASAETKGKKQSGVASAEAKGKKRSGVASAEAKKKRSGVASAEAKGKALANAPVTGSKEKGSPKAAGVKAKGTSKSAAAKPKGKSAGGTKQAASKRKTATKAAAGKRTGKAAAAVQANPVAEAANQRNAPSRRKKAAQDLFLEREAALQPSASGGTPPTGRRALFGALNACLAIAIAVLVALGLQVHSRYGEFLMMRDVVDKQTFYEGTTVEGVDVSKMTLSDAMDYWRGRVEARNAGRTVVLSDGTTVTAGELGYASDYESVLTTAWSHGRSGTLEERYRMASSRMQNPAAYVIHRTNYDDALVDRFVELQALKIDEPATDAAVADFNVETYEYTFSPSRPGAQLDADALRRDLVTALEAGGGDVTLAITELPPQITTDQIGQMYGLIDYAITNASSSSKSRLNNIKLAMSMINGVKLEPGETFSFNERVGQRTSDRGFRMATAFSGGEVTEQVGGGICQVSTTLFNAAVKADMQIDERHNHSLTVAYVDKGKDATVDWGHQDLKFTNTSADDIYICCYLTDDKRVRFGIFGRLLPNGEKITLDAVTTRAIKFETEYQPDPSLPSGQTRVSQSGKDGYKAETYKVRWDAEGNELSRELLCSSIYKAKNEIILYGA